jgi:hypothetical protein
MIQALVKRPAGALLLPQVDLLAVEMPGAVSQDGSVRQQPGAELPFAPVQLSPAWLRSLPERLSLLAQSAEKSN